MVFQPISSADTRRSALTLGRPSYLHGDQHNVPTLTTADFDDTDIHGESSSLSTSRSREENVSSRMFIAMADLSIILSDVLSTFYTVSAVHTLKNIPAYQKDACIFSFIERLDQWNSAYSFLFEENRDLLPDPTGAYICVLPSILKYTYLSTAQALCSLAITRWRLLFVEQSFVTSMTILFGRGASK